MRNCELRWKMIFWYWFGNYLIELSQLCGGKQEMEAQLHKWCSHAVLVILTKRPLVH